MTATGQITCFAMIIIISRSDTLIYSYSLFPFSPYCIYPSSESHTSFPRSTVLTCFMDTMSVCSGMSVSNCAQLSLFLLLTICVKVHNCKAYISSTCTYHSARADLAHCPVHTHRKLSTWCMIRKEWKHLHDKIEIFTHIILKVQIIDHISLHKLKCCQKKRQMMQIT